MSCRHLLQEFCSPYEDKCFDCGRKLLREKNSKMQKRVQKTSLIPSQTLEFTGFPILCRYVIEWKPLITITLGPALFDNNYRLITLSGVNILASRKACFDSRATYLGHHYLPIQYNRISSLHGNEVCQTSTLFNDRPVLSAESNQRFELLNPSAHSKLEYRMLFPNNETG